MNTAQNTAPPANFHTASALVNFAIDHSFYEAAGLDLKASRQHKVAVEDLNLRFTKAQDLIDQLPRLFWHSIELQKGRRDGFQLFIDTNWTDIQEYAERMEDIWNTTGAVNSADGEPFLLNECPYFAKNCKKVTKATLLRAIKREKQKLIDLLLQKSKELELGKVQSNGSVVYS